MNIIKKIGLTASVLTTLFASSALMAEDVEIVVASFPNFNKVAEKVAPIFQEKYPGIKIKFVNLAYSDHHNAMTTALATGTNLPDVMAIEASYIGRFAQSGGLENLNNEPYKASDFASKITPFTLTQASDVEGRLRAIPADIGPGALFYRQDILSDAGVSEQELTKSWDSFIQAGVKVKQKSGNYLIASAVDIKDIYIRSNLKDGEGIYFDSKHNILVNSPRFKEAFRLAKKARTAGIDARVSAWSNEWTEGLRRGTISVQMMGAWLGGHLQDWIAPDAVGLWRSVKLPQGALASWGGSFYAIPVKAKNKTAAWQFIKFLTTQKDAQLIGFKEINAFPALIEAQDDPFFDQALPYLGGQKARLEWKKTATAIPAIAMDRFDEVARQVVNDALEKVLEKDADIDAVLLAAEKQIKRRARRR